MFTEINLQPLALLLLCVLSLAVSGEENEWDAARPQIMQEAILEIREYPELKYLPSSQVRLFASCLVEKRILMAKEIGCGWAMNPSATVQEHLAEQYLCFERGGYGQAARQDHGKFCGILVTEYFRASEGE